MKDLDGLPVGLLIRQRVPRTSESRVLRVMSVKSQAVDCQKYVTLVVILAHTKFPQSKDRVKLLSDSREN